MNFDAAVKIENFIHEWIYPAERLKRILFHRLDVVDLPSKKIGEYVNGYDRMLEAAMEIVCDYVDDERGNPKTDWNDREDTKSAWESMNGIYSWWRIDRMKMQNDLNQLRELYKNLFSDSGEDDFVTAWTDVSASAPILTPKKRLSKNTPFMKNHCKTADCSSKPYLPLKKQYTSKMTR